MDCSPSGSFYPGILLARILDWVAMSSSSRASQPRDRARVSASPALQADSLPLSTREALVRLSTGSKIFDAFNLLHDDLRFDITYRKFTLKNT